MRDLMVGKTAPASLMLSSYACTNGSCDRSDCFNVLGPDGNAVIKPYRSVPNIDLLLHTEASFVTCSNEVEDISRLHGIQPASTTNTQQCQSIPEIVVVCCNDEPDIVQSTKSSSLPRQAVMPAAQPVAPPRRKKTKTPSPLSADVAHEVYMPHLLISICNIVDFIKIIFCL